MNGPDEDDETFWRDEARVVDDSAGWDYYREAP